MVYYRYMYHSHLSEIKANKECLWSTTVISAKIFFFIIQFSHSVLNVPGCSCRISKMNVCVCWVCAHPSLCYYARGALGATQPDSQSTPRENMTPCGSYLFGAGSLYLRGNEFSPMLCSDIFWFISRPLGVILAGSFLWLYFYWSDECFQASGDGRSDALPKQKL